MNFFRIFFDAFLFNSNLAANYQMGFQKPASPIAEGIFVFHDDLRVFLTAILFFVMCVLYFNLTYFTATKKGSKTTHHVTHASVLEIVWTIVPALILVVIAIPSFSLLYSIDEVVESFFNVKVIGHQWYWSYEYLNPEVITKLYNGAIGLDHEFQGAGSFDSYMLSDEDILNKEGLTSLRLLTVDNHLFLPTEMQIRAIITSADVIHSWAIPSLGVKLDACPGRLNQTSIFIKRDGFFYGQCSEICGVNHGFMPIGIISQGFFGGNLPSTFDFEPILAFMQANVIE